MTLVECLAVGCALATGALLGRVVDRSGFSLDRAFRAPALEGDAESLRGWLLGFALLLAVAAAGALAGLPAVRPVPLGPVAAVLAGLVAGVAGAIVAADPVSAAHGAGRTRLPDLVTAAGWLGGVAAGSAGALGALNGWIAAAGPPEVGALTLAVLTGVPGWVLQLGAAGLLGWALLKIQVVVAPGRMEWPRAGAGLALVAVAGGALALQGGETAGLNAVSAARTIIEAPALGKLWLHPSLLVGAGMVLHGFTVALREGRLFPEMPSPASRLPVRGAAGFALGLACALAGGDPLHHACYGLPALSLGSAVFVLACFCGALLMGMLEWRGRGRPGGAPNRGHGV